MNDITYPRYAWILHGWYRERWWTQEVANSSLDCNDKELETFLMESKLLTIFLNPVPEDENALTISGIVSCPNTSTIR